MSDSIVSMIRRDEVVARLMDERCHHFTKGGASNCSACLTEAKGQNLSQKLVELEANMDNEQALHGDSVRYLAMMNEWCDLTGEIGELGHP